MNLSSEVDFLRITANGQLDRIQKLLLGQFFTNAPIGQFMASLFYSIGKEVRLLEPGAGVGSLIAAFTEEVIRRETTTSLHIDAYEIDKIVRPFLCNTIGKCRHAVAESAIKVTGSIKDEDFVIAGSNFLRDSLEGSYTHVIMNPPYKKINNSSDYRIALSKAGIETVNLYSGFMALAIKMLQPGGELVAIIPRSFCNGPYYQAFREIILKETFIRNIHVFDARDQAFNDDDVLQENVIFHLEKGGAPSPITITSSPIADFHYDEESEKYVATDMTIRVVDLQSIVKPNDNQKFMHLAANARDQHIIDTLACFSSTLTDIGIQVSTGPVVDFRHKEDLRNDVVEGSVPLLYPVHFNGNIKFPKPNKKGNAIVVNEKTLPWLFENSGSYVLTKRFSSKEEKRRIVANVYEALPAFRYIGFENKLNVFHSKKAGFDLNIAKGLFVYLNSTLIDRFYRQFGGHTQVNATDLKSLHFPDLNTLKRMGEKVSTWELDQKQVDEILENQIKSMNHMTETNPLKAQVKIEEAITILKELGMPGMQQNERSALTLLALLNLTPEKDWHDVENPMMGVTPIMDWSKVNYGKEYAPNTRETFRRQTLHQFQAAGIVMYNPDKPTRAVNSPKACYQILPELRDVLKAFNGKDWEVAKNKFRENKLSLVARYAMPRENAHIPVTIAGQELKLSPGDHSHLISDILTKFEFAPGAEVVYIGETGIKHGYFKSEILAEIGVAVNDHGKMPDVVLYQREKNWLFLIESVTSHGPVDGKRYDELTALFADSTAGLIFVSAFPDRKTFNKYQPKISWETEVWIADAPKHLIHYNGHKFLGPYQVDSNDECS